MSTPNAWDKALHKANAYLLVAGIFIQPEKGVMKITEKAPKIARILSRCKMVESVTAKLDNTKYLRIYIDNIGQDEIKALAEEFEKSGAHVSKGVYKAEDGRQFMAVAETDIFEKLGSMLDDEDGSQLIKFAQKIDPSTISDPGVKAIYVAAQKAESQITDDLLYIAEDVGGNLHGLEFRLKTPESTLGKIHRDRVDLIKKVGEDVASTKTDAEIAGDFKDIVRYTFTAEPENLVSKTQRFIARLESEPYNYRVIQIKNTFTDPTNPMDMINMRVVSPEGQIFEIQANTPHNVYVKDELMHDDYEAWRIIEDENSPEAQRLSKKMFKTAEQFERPKDIEILK